MNWRISPLSFPFPLRMCFPWIHFDLFLFVFATLYFRGRWPPQETWKPAVSFSQSSPPPLQHYGPAHYLWIRGSLGVMFSLFTPFELLGSGSRPPRGLSNIGLYGVAAAVAACLFVSHWAWMPNGTERKSIAVIIHLQINVKQLK